MAAVDVFGDQYTAAFVTKTRVSPSAAGAEVHVITDSTTVNAVEAGSTITFGAAKVPKGARILTAEVRSGVLGTSVQLALAVNGVTIVAAHSAAAASVGYLTASGITDTAVTADAFPIVTTSGATTASNDIKVEIILTYTFF